MRLRCARCNVFKEKYNLITKKVQMPYAEDGEEEEMCEFIMGYCKNREKCPNRNEMPDKSFPLWEEVKAKRKLALIKG